MKIVLTGSNGHISGPLAQRLAQAGHSVSLITSKSEKSDEIRKLGAEPIVGSVTDPAFLTSAFSGADLVYLMIPPIWSVTDWFGYQKEVAHAYLQAVQANGIKKVMILSSIGAHMKKGCGPVDGVAYLEDTFSGSADFTVRALRPSYFYYNLFSMKGLIQHMGILGSAQPAEYSIILTDTNDIVDAAMEDILNWNFTGFSFRYIGSDQRTWAEIAQVLGTSIGKPELPYVEFSDAQSESGMVQAGLPPALVQGYLTMGKALRSGEMEADFKANPPAKWGKIKLEDFARSFAQVYQQS